MSQLAACTADGKRPQPTKIALTWIATDATQRNWAGGGTVGLQESR